MKYLLFIPAIVAFLLTSCASEPKFTTTTPVAGMSWKIVDLPSGRQHVSLVIKGNEHHIGHMEKFEPVDRSSFSSLGVPGSAKLAARFWVPGAIGGSGERAYVVLESGKAAIYRSYSSNTAGSGWQFYKAFPY